MATRYKQVQLSSYVLKLTDMLLHEKTGLRRTNHEDDTHVHRPVLGSPLRPEALVPNQTKVLWRKNTLVNMVPTKNKTYFSVSTIFES